MSLATGVRLGRYEIRSRLGAGGMGEVYLAQDTQLRRPVALKILPSHLTNDADRLRRFEREAQAAAALNHPNIAHIYEIGEINGVHFIAMEYVDGNTLREIINREAASLKELLEYLTQVADGLGKAHAAGIVHRDLKPDNIMITRDGYAKVLDFGLAKLIEPQAQTEGDLRESPTVVVEPQTQSGVLMGTVDYMSPEQASGAHLGPASDIFSFGILAYELLTGGRPFKGSGPGAVLSAIINARHVPLSEIRSDLPARLVAVVERCLEKDSGRRFHNGGELAGALRRVATSEGSPYAEEATAGRSSTPSASSPSRQQDIRFCATADGVHLAYSVIGAGPLLVRVLGHFTHLEMEWEWPDLRHFWEQLAGRYTVVRYDGRGTGLSDRYTGEFTEETRQLDLDAVLTAVGAESAILFGISEGGWTAATYATLHPERVSHLILYGAYCRGSTARPGYDREENEALVTLIRKGWGRDTPAFRQVFTSLFFRPDADPKLIAHFNEMQRASADSETAARYHQSCLDRGDGRELFRRVRVPTLVVHCRDDMAVSAEEGRLLASVIPGARLVLLPSGAHYFPADREVIMKVVGAINRFIDGVEER